MVPISIMNMRTQDTHGDIDTLFQWVNKIGYDKVHVSTRDSFADTLRSESAHERFFLIAVSQDAVCIKEESEIGGTDSDRSSYGIRP